MARGTSYRKFRFSLTLVKRGRALPKVAAATVLSVDTSVYLCALCGCVPGLSTAEETDPHRGKYRRVCLIQAGQESSKLDPRLDRNNPSFVAHVEQAANGFFPVLPVI